MSNKHLPEQEKINKLVSLYEKNLAGLITCYYMAIPFFTNTLISTIIFSYCAYSANYFFIKKTV